MKILLKPLQWIYCLYALALFIGIMILLFPFVMMAALFGRIRGGNMVYRLCIIWGDIWFFLVLIYHRNYYEQPLDKNKQYVFVGNHISYLDAPILVKTIRRPIRALGRIELSNTPVFGFIYRMVVVIVDRSDAAHRAKSVRNLKSIINKGVSIIIMPEGTFNKTSRPLKDFFDGAFRVAIETQTTIKPFLLLDAYDRLHYKNLFTLTPGKSRTVFLEEVDVDGLTIEDIPDLKQKVYTLMEKKLLEYKASWIKTLSS
ncbi:MAG TPA: lysophospholipid acyltransferase family protein [Chitinophagaceae bacterium]|nr:lysophospholipid acyltransferase family protein [Chitinophagaceae bacterium]